jgi:hypothetical protein
MIILNKDTNDETILYSHIDFNINLENDSELYSLIKKIELSLLHLNITLWTKNSFIQNTNEFWYAPISIESDGINYMYTFKYDIKLKILYGCPCKKTLEKSINTLPLTHSINPSLFNMIEKGIFNKLESY